MLSTQVLDQQEKSDQLKAGTITLVLNGLLLLSLFFLNAWTAPQPQMPMYGVELNFGLDNVGSGDIQTKNKASDLKTKVESKPAETKVVPKTQPEKVEKVEVKPVKITKPVVKDPPVKVSKVESPVKVPEVKETEKPKPTSKPIENKPVETKPVEAPKPQVDSKALYKKGNSKSNGTNGTSDQPGGNNNGDDKNKVGDKGDPEGKVDAKALYGNKGKGGNGNGSGNGSGGGASLNLTGWTWSAKPTVNDDSDESGKIVFQIKVDDQGDVISIRIVEKTVSQSVAEIYKKAVERINFVATSSGDRPSSSTGTIVFIIKSR